MPRATADGFKVCSKCDQNKSVSEYNRDKGNLDGLTSRCRKCSNERSTKWRVENKDKVDENNRNWYVNNRDRAIGKSQAWRDANPGYSKARYAKNPEDGRARRASRLARKAELPAIPYTLAEIVDRDGTVCVLTGKDIDITDRSSFEVDHLIPIQVDMDFYNSIEPHAPHPGDQLGSVRIVDARANSGRGNRMTVLDHVELQCRMPCWFTRAAIEQHYSKRS